MARYDITGIGINIREVSDDTGSVKLKVQGLILDGPAHTAGVRQVYIRSTAILALVNYFVGSNNVFSFSSPSTHLSLEKKF